MAEYKKEKLQDTDKSGFGKYGEATGGGASPNPQKPGTHGHGVNSDYRQANNDTNQPRTEDGKFTYKSVNGKSIDPKYGPSRGKTVNPLLTGGVNGLYIDDLVDDKGNLLQEGVKSQFAKQSGAIWNKYKDKWYQKGGEMSLSSKGQHHKEGFSTRVSAMAIWEVGRLIYNEKLGEFGGDIEFEHKLGNGGIKQGSGYGGISEGKELFAKGKKGARTAEESQAFQKAQASGQEQAVMNAANGAIQVKPGTVQPAVKQVTRASSPSPFRRKAFIPGQSINPQTINPSVPTPSSVPSGQFLNFGGNKGASSNGLTSAQQQALNTLFGGQAPQLGSVNTSAMPTLQGFLNSQKKNN